MVRTHIKLCGDRLPVRRAVARVRGVLLRPRVGHRDAAETLRARVGARGPPLHRRAQDLGGVPRKFPGAQNSLDALCRRFNIDNSGRQKHGALLDSEILAEVYLELVGGRQPDFSLSLVGQTNSNNYVDNSTGKIFIFY